MRALVGDAMAYEMMQGLAGSAAPVMEMSAKTSSGMPCHEFESQSDMAAEANASSCTTCQVCNLTVFLPVGLHFALFQLPQLMLAQRIDNWRSFDAVSASKPPIL